MRRLILLVPALVAAALLGCNETTIESSNTPPEATIELPAEATSALEGTQVEFRGVVTDRVTVAAELELVWSSSLDGELLSGAPNEDGSTGFSRDDLSVGEHTITLQVWDADAATGTATRTLVVTADLPPSISIEQPSATDLIYSDIAVTLTAMASDAETAPADLVVQFRDESGTPFTNELDVDSDGRATGSSLLPEGSVSIVAEVTDSAGQTATDTVTVVVGPPSTAPTCGFVSPADSSVIPLGDSVEFVVWAEDVDVPSTLLLGGLTSDVDGDLGLSTFDANDEATAVTASLAAGAHSITLLVTDDVELTCTATLALTIDAPPTSLITSPLAADLLDDATATALEGEVHDTEDADADLDVVWDSDLDGVLASPTPDSGGLVSSSATLSAGTHTLTLTVTDSASQTASDTVTVLVNAVPTAPVVSITPGTPTTDDDLTVVLDTPSTDPDLGPFTLVHTYAWALGGVAQPAWDGLDTVPASATANGDVWSVTVAGTDGQSTSPSSTASVTVGCVAGSGQEPTCPAPSCLDIFNAGLSVGDGLYWLDPNNVGTAIQLDCDMTGGGWTGITWDAAWNDLNGVVVAEDPAPYEGVDAVNGPWTQDEGGAHTYHFTFDFGAGYDAFYLDGWEVKANAVGPHTSDIWTNFFQTLWTVGQSCGINVCGTSDISFGDPDAAGPVAGYAQLVTTNFSCVDCVIPYWGGSTQYTLAQLATGFRVGWGEGGGQYEGWYPWWGGVAYLK